MLAMFLRTRAPLNILSPTHRVIVCLKCLYGSKLDEKYSEDQKVKILKVINDSDINTLSSYDISKARLKKISQWKNSNGQLVQISDVETIEGFSEKTSKKLFDSILAGPVQNADISNKIKGQILHPNLSESVRQKCKSVLTVYVAVNSVSWALIDRANYEVLDWKYNSIDYPDGKKFTIIDILNISWQISQQLPIADVYVMKAEATTLRATGSDPNNPKVLAVNLQKAQMISMIVALIHARTNSIVPEGDPAPEKTATENSFKHSVYFLRPTLPFRLYGTLIGNEKVSTDQTIEMLLSKINEPSADNTKVFMSEDLKSMFRSQKDLAKDMLGHCLLLGLTFMDLCIYKNQESISKLLKKQNSND